MLRAWVALGAKTISSLSAPTSFAMLVLSRVSTVHYEIGKIIDAPCLHNQGVEDLAVDFVGVPLNFVCQTCRSKKDGER